MPTSKPPLSGRGQTNRIGLQDKYQSDSRSKSMGNFMTTFSRTKSSQLVTAWDDTNYLYQLYNSFHFLADATSAVDAATVGDPGFLVLLDAAWERFFTNANIKDLVATDEASWKLYVCCACQIVIDFQLMHDNRTLLPAFAESNTTPGASSGAKSYFDQDAWDTLVSSFKDYPIPALAIELGSIFAGWIIQIAPEYEKHTIRIPPSYIKPFWSVYDLEDYQAIRDLMRVNLGGFITHSKKYGLKNGTMPALHAPVIKTLNDSDVMAFFNHCHFMFYDNTPGQQRVNPDGGFMGTNLTTTYTGVHYFFKDTPNESKLHVLAPWFGIYDITNNPYGGLIITGNASAVEYRANFDLTAQHGVAAGVNGSIATHSEIIQMFKAFWDGNSAIFECELTGTNMTADQQVVDHWPLALHNNAFYGTNRPAVATNNDLLNFIGRACV